MTFQLIIRGQDTDALMPETLEEVADIVRATRSARRFFIDLPEPPTAWAIEVASDAARSAIQAFTAARQLDSAWIPFARNAADIRVAAFDMDSTLITIECIDEIADYAGVKPEVAAITAAAMRGEITDYRESLRQRVALLAGLPAAVLEDVYRDRLRYTHGAQALVRSLKKKGVHLLLVSGGFTFFTDRLVADLGFDAARSNILEIREGRLTGQLVGPIVDARVKADTLKEFSDLKVARPSTDVAIAVGDGANDLAMMDVAALSFAHHAKPAVQARATHAINHSGLDTLLAWLGYHA
jgi:phosphoserine phosphatase